jgi:hypothetical protein
MLLSDTLRWEAMTDSRKRIWQKSNIHGKLVVALTVLISLSRPVGAFDTFWHAEATRKSENNTGSAGMLLAL